MAIKVAALNAARGLSNDERAAGIASGITKLGADIVVVSEALDKRGRLADSDFARNLGYRAITTEYEDAEPHPSHRQYLTVMVSRFAVAFTAEVIRLNSRNAIAFGLEDPETGERIYGVGAHFDDRDEEKRFGMAESFLYEHGYADVKDPNGMFGDLNIMHEDDPRARVLRSAPVRALAHVAPHPRIRSLGTRLNEQADGATMNLLESAGYTDADPDWQPTMTFAGHAVVQLDHIMTSQNLAAEEFEVHKIEGTDHRAISASLYPN